MTIKSPIKYPSGKDHPEVYVPMGNARYQQRWCHQMLDELESCIAVYRSLELDKAMNKSIDLMKFYKKKLLKELYRKEYYEEKGWDFTFRVFNITVIEIGPWMRTYHAWVGVKGQKFTIQLPRVKA